MEKMYKYFIDGQEVTEARIGNYLLTAGYSRQFGKARLRNGFVIKSRTGLELKAEEILIKGERMCRLRKAIEQELKDKYLSNELLYVSEDKVSKKDLMASEIYIRGHYVRFREYSKCAYYQILEKQSNS